MKQKKKNRSQKRNSERSKPQRPERKTFFSPSRKNAPSSQSSDEPLVGKIKRHPDGFGFFIPENPDHPDIYIPKHSMTGVMTGDRIAIKAYPEGFGEDRFRGEVVRILERGSKKIVGKFQSQPNYGLIKDEGKGWGQDLMIQTKDRMQAKDGDLVTVEILEYPDEGKTFSGRVVQVLGDINDPMNDIKRVIAAQNIPDEFPREVIAQSEQFPSVPSDKEFQNRRDLTQRPLITIDGATAKDFDDAILTEMTPQGFRLFVAIADVSHYVKPDSPMDQEAYMRGNSVYFPNFVVPMLPEALSNGLCSLNPHVPRLCLVAEMEFDFQGHKRSSQFYEAVMNSKARMTYGEVQEIIEGNPLQKPGVQNKEQVQENIMRSADLAKILMAKRYHEGSLDLEIPETELLIDASGMPIDVIRAERLFAHRLIEEMMLAANVAVAEFLTAAEIPSLYRIHEPPNPQALIVLEKYLNMFGGHTKLDAASLMPPKNKNSSARPMIDAASLPPGRLQKKLTKALEEFKGKPEGQILHILTLRSMAQAKYATNNVGHFGLGFADYTHFTSPIRRYPDLIVHRLLKSQILKNSSYQTASEDGLASAGTWLSSCEQKAAKSERQIKAIKKARFLQKFLGEEFEGMISSVTRFGVFVLLREYDVDGLIKIDDLSQNSDFNDRFVFDEDNLRLVAKRSGYTFEIGHKVKVQVVSADIELGQVNFTLTESLEPAKETARKEKSKAKGTKKSASSQPQRFAQPKEEVPAVDQRKRSLRFRSDLPAKTPKQKFHSTPSSAPKVTASSGGGSKREQILKMLDEQISQRQHQPARASGKNSHPEKPDKENRHGQNASKGKDRAKNKNQSSRSNFKKRR